MMCTRRSGGTGPGDPLRTVVILQRWSWGISLLVQVPTPASQQWGGLPSHLLIPPPRCRGAFSYLRRVTEKSSRLDFAAKFVPGRTKAKQSARRELHILSQLDHERIVFFHDAFEKKNAVIMVMELYPPGAWCGGQGRAGGQ